jgi:hypothetical protein
VPLVRTVDLQLSNLPASLFQEHVREVSAAAVRAGPVSLAPFVKAALAELLLTAVDHVRLTQHLHTDGTAQFFRKSLNKLIINIFRAI